MYNSFSKLIRTVRMSTYIFFSGDLETAKETTTSALALFRTVADQKAIGVASNNLANICFVMLMRDAGTLGAKQIDLQLQFDEAIIHYDRSIEEAQQCFEQSSDDIVKCDYGQLLANRLFNKAMCCLHAENLQITDDSREIALNCLERTFALDRDIAEVWLDQKLLLKNSARYFDRLISRLHGLLEFPEDPDVQRIGNASSIVEEADELLSAAWKEHGSSLFREHTRIGRLQQLESIIVKLHLLANETKHAARMAIRMLVEDEYLQEPAFSVSGTAVSELLFHNTSSTMKGSERIWSNDTVTAAHRDLLQTSKRCKTKTMDFGKCVVLCIEGTLVQQPAEQLQYWLQALYEHVCADKDFVGIVMSSEGSIPVCHNLKQKGLHKNEHLEELLQATSSKYEKPVNREPLLPFASQMLLDSPETNDKNCWIIHIRLGLEDDDPTKLLCALQQLKVHNECKEDSSLPVPDPINLLLIDAFSSSYLRSTSSHNPTVISDASSTASSTWVRAANIEERVESISSRSQYWPLPMDIMQTKNSTNDNVYRAMKNLMKEQQQAQQQHRRQQRVDYLTMETF